MSRTVVVEVTAEDIAKGKPNNACGCPVALAAQRACPEFGGWFGVYRSRRGSLGLGTNSSYRDAPLPKKAAEWVRRFDKRGGGRPFTFTVELS